MLYIIVHKDTGGRYSSYYHDRESARIRLSKLGGDWYITVVSRDKFNDWPIHWVDSEVLG